MCKSIWLAVSSLAWHLPELTFAVCELALGVVIRCFGSCLVAAAMIRTIRRWCRKALWALILPPAILSDTIVALALRLDPRVMGFEPWLSVAILGFLGAGWITTLAQGAYTALQTSMEWAGVRDVSLSSSVFEICNDLLMEFTGVSTCESWWQHLSIRLVVRLNFRFDSACACIVQGMLLVVWGFIVLCLKAWQLAACWPYATCWLVCSLTCLKLE